MQVFLPFPSFEKSVQCLDNTRLGNQVWRECKTLLNGGWRNHPVSKMWIYHKPALATYALCGLQELVRRNDIRPQPLAQLTTYFQEYLPSLGNPTFIGNEQFHRSHRLNLLWKNPDWYSQFFDEPIPHYKPEYYWPGVPLR